MLYTTASKHLQKLWNWPYLHSVEKIITVPLNISVYSKFLEKNLNANGLFQQGT